jgi:hypothetical protein
MSTKTKSASDQTPVDTFTPHAPLDEAELDPPPPKVAVTRDSVKEVLVESIETSTGRKPVKLMLTIFRTVDGKKIRTQKCVEIFTRDRQMAAGALKMLGQELAMFKGESGRLPGAIKLGTKEQARALFLKYYPEAEAKEKTPIQPTEAEL